MNLPGENLIGKMWESIVDKGIGGLLTPWHQRRKGRAATENRVEEMLAIAKAEAEIAKIRARKTHDFLGGPLLINGPELDSDAHASNLTTAKPSAAEISLHFAQVDLIRKEVNVAKAVLVAEEILTINTEAAGGDQSAGEEQPDVDWLFRWRDFASSMSSEKMQRLWGSVLAGEVKSPGHYSLRTLDFLKSLSTSEAEIIELAAQFVVDDFMWRGSNFDHQSKVGLGMEMLLRLENLGLINGVGGQGFERSWQSALSPGIQLVFHCGKKLLVSRGPAKKVVIPVIHVSTLGREVFSLCQDQYNAAYVRGLGELLKSQGLVVTLCERAGPQDKDGNFAVKNMQQL